MAMTREGKLLRPGEGRGFRIRTPDLLNAMPPVEGPLTSTRVASNSNGPAWVASQSTTIHRSPARKLSSRSIPPKRTGSVCGFDAGALADLVQARRDGESAESL